MIRSILRASSVAALLVTLSACADRETAPTLVAPEVPSAGRTVFLSLSDLAPKAGDEVVVTINSIAAPGERVGSFKVRLGLATAGLEYLESLPQTDGMIIANRVEDALIVVGASGEGFTTNALASVRVKVADPSKLDELAVSVEGLATTEFVNQAPATSVERRLFRRSLTK